MYVNLTFLQIQRYGTKNQIIMARKTKKQAQETRQQILDTALRVFSEHGVSATSLSDIATAAGVTRGAIYWHFKNKAEIFEIGRAHV